ncbi:IS200/IS605 family transposase [Bacteroidota bacterium]
MKKRLLGHTAYKIEYHIIWNTKYRHPVLEGDVRLYLGRLLYKILDTMLGCELIEYSIQPDHVHTLVSIPPKYAVSKVVGRIKGRTSSKLRERFSSLKKLYWKENLLWSPGYYVSTVGVREKKIIDYIQNQ